VPALECVVVGGPDSPHHLERLLEECGPLVEINSESEEFAFEVAHADRQREATVREQVQRRPCLGYHERVAAGKHDDVRDQPQRRGVGRGIAHRDEGIERVVPARVEPALRRRRVIGEPESAEPGGLGGGGDL